MSGKTSANHPMRILVCGSRFWNDSKIIQKKLSKYQKGTVIIHGVCRGADLIAAEISKELGFDVKPFPANWRRYGRAAGPIRNKEMLEKGKPDLVIAFHQDIGESVGTKNMINQAMKSGLTVHLISK